MLTAIVIQRVVVRMKLYNMVKLSLSIHLSSTHPSIHPFTYAFLLQPCAKDGERNCEANPMAAFLAGRQPSTQTASGECVAAWLSVRVSRTVREPGRKQRSRGVDNRPTGSPATGNMETRAGCAGTHAQLCVWVTGARDGLLPCFWKVPERWWTWEGPVA